MSIRGTENYIYYSEQVLGAGSTATVYFGRHKRKGEPCAVKLFSNQTTERRVAIRNNELKHMQSLDHKNIVKMLAIEEDSKTKDTALIMELCSEGSIQKLLENSKYFYGFPEPLLADFIGQLSSGLHYLRLHGIGHRDVKPGNILCSVDEDRRITFKLTDFGASRELLLEGANRTALYGTEEYLHPVMYNAVFIEKQPIKDDYEASCELWSIGATMYHVATGQQPFQVYGGRNNREKMFSVISNKPSGVISGIQKLAAGDVEYSDKLPKHCFLSLGITQKLVPLLSGLLESDFKKQIQFDDRFFPACNEISQSVLVIFLNVFRCCFHHCYLPEKVTYAALVTEISKQMKEEFDGWRITEQDLLLFYESRPLSDVINKENDIGTFPTTSMANPIVVLPLPEKMPSDTPEPMLTSLPGFPRPQGEDKSSDASWSQSVAAYSWRAIAVVQSLLHVQNNTSKCRFNVISFIKSRYKTVVERLTKSLSELGPLKTKHVMVSIRVPVVCEQLTVAAESARKSGFLKSWVPQMSSGDQKEIIKSVDAVSRQLNEDVETLSQVIEQLGSLINTSLSEMYSIDVGSAGMQPLASCEEGRCVAKMETHYEKANQIHEQFMKERTATLTYNQDQLHKFEKVKLEERVKLVTNTVYRHCWSATLTTRKEFNTWYRSTVQFPMRTILGLEVLASSLKDKTSRVDSALDQLLTQCDQYAELASAKDSLKALKNISPNRTVSYTVKRLAEELKGKSADPVSAGLQVEVKSGVNTESSVPVQGAQSSEETADEQALLMSKYMDELFEIRQTNGTLLRHNEQLALLLREGDLHFREFEVG